MKTHFLIILTWISIVIFTKDTLLLIEIAFLVGLISIVILAVMFLVNSELFHLFFKGFWIIGKYITPENRGLNRTNELIKKDQSFQRFKENLQQHFRKMLIWTGIYSITVSILFTALLV
ncbi:DUF3899 domain-containing protein [Virgibacillus halodenitrificans]|uniref:DUF3899 domain-containing protein n=1 Tax=Virgibacillus halodenitrificans TaxID=1482 RepID=A0ABR7VK22_VIRHA|nr:DUF3899 domain-containing protein [Virgibacillus halodenitrificans]MBD1221133.1 DUF3899 domain-containing protein [Virgibacillus halodenitrificans]MCG1027232.1 DUF3899 domain-containing protein [Virgibacillus halodenitrificans]